MDFRKKIDLISVLVGIITAVFILKYVKSDPAFAPVSYPIITTSPDAVHTGSIPNEPQLIQCYTDALADLTNSSIASSTYENMKQESDGTYIEIRIKMNDGKLLNISAKYDTDNQKWDVYLINDYKKKIPYYVPDELESSIDLYDYNTDKLKHKIHSKDSYQVKKMKFQFSSDWTHGKTKNIPCIFHDKKSLYSISVYTQKIQNESADFLWSIYSTLFDDYKLQMQFSLKVGGREAKQWKFSYTSDSKLSENMITIITYKKTAYFIQWQSKFGFGQYESPEYEALLKSVTWK